MSLPLPGYNTLVALVAVSLLGVSAGLVGVFALLRRRALMSDAMSHAALPGVALAFLLGAAANGEGPSILLLAAGAALTAWLGAVGVQWIRSHTRLGDDAAIACVLSLFFALGIVLLGVIQTLPAAGQAGLGAMLLGAAAALTFQDALFMATLAVVVAVILLFLTKEFTLLAFDSAFAGACGWPVKRLDALLMLLLTGVVVGGLQAVGVILMVALVVIPPAIALLWSRTLTTALFTAAGVAALCCMAGTLLSATTGGLPTGALIVCCAGGLFFASLPFAPYAAFRRRG